MARTSRRDCGAEAQPKQRTESDSIIMNNTISGSGAAAPQLIAGAVFLTILIVALVFSVVVSALIYWKVFTKAGKPGWASLIPIYNCYVLTQVAGKEWWWFLLLFIPIINIIAWIMICIGVAGNFGKGAGFAVGLILLGIIFFPILGFGSAVYGGAPQAPPAA
jgi:hypothetical protein